MNKNIKYKIYNTNARLIENFLNLMLNAQTLIEKTTININNKRVRM